MPSGVNNALPANIASANNYNSESQIGNSHDQPSLEQNENDINNVLELCSYIKCCEIEKRIGQAREHFIITLNGCVNLIQSSSKQGSRIEHEIELCISKLRHLGLSFKNAQTLIKGIVRLSWHDFTKSKTTKPNWFGLTTKKTTGYIYQLIHSTKDAGPENTEPSPKTEFQNKNSQNDARSRVLNKANATNNEGNTHNILS